MTEYSPNPKLAQMEASRKELADEILQYKMKFDDEILQYKMKLCVICKKERNGNKLGKKLWGECYHCKARSQPYLFCVDHNNIRDFQNHQQESHEVQRTLKKRKRESTERPEPKIKKNLPRRK